MRFTLESFDKRQAITAWRDHWRFHIWTAMRNSGENALKNLDLNLPDASNWDVYVNNTSFAYPRIDKSMRRQMQHIFDEVRIQAAAGLHEIDTTLDCLGLELTQIDFKDIMPPLPEILSKEISQEASSSTNDQTLVKAIGSTIAVVAGGIIAGPELAIAAGAYGIASIATPLFHGWIRNAGSKRLAEAWLGTTGEPLPVMPKVAAIFDDFAERARSLLP